MIQISYNCLPKSSIKRFSPNCISTSGLSLDSRERRESESYAEGVRLPVVYLSLFTKMNKLREFLHEIWSKYKFQSKIIKNFGILPWISPFSCLSV